MIKRLLVIGFIFLSLSSSAIVVTDEYLTTIENKDYIENKKRTPILVPFFGKKQ